MQASRHRPPRASPRRPLPSEAAKPVTIDWWHIRTTTRARRSGNRSSRQLYGGPSERPRSRCGPGERGLQAEITTQLQGGDVPDLFQSWGGGGVGRAGDCRLRQKDLTERLIASWKDLVEIPAPWACTRSTEKQYSVPFDLGMVGFWYNKDLFTQAGMRSAGDLVRPASGRRRQAPRREHHPLALGERESGPACSGGRTSPFAPVARTAMDNAIKTGDWSAPSFVAAGKALQDLIARSRFGQGSSQPRGMVPVARRLPWRRGRVPADGAVGSRHDAEPDARTRSRSPSTSGGSASRRSRAAPGRPPTGSVAGTASRSARTLAPEAIDFLKFINNSDNAAK